MLFLIQKASNDAVLTTFSGYVKGQTLKAGTSQTINVTIEYNPYFDGDPKEGSSEIETSFNYVQPDQICKGDECKKNYLVTYDCTSNGGDEMASNTEYVYSGENIDLTKKCYKKGYTFDGFSTSLNYQDKTTNIKMGSTPITIYGIYSKKINVKYTTDEYSTIDKTNETCTMYNLDENCLITLPTITPNTNFKEDGFYLDNKLIGHSKDKYNVNKDIEINARSKDTTPPTIILDPDGSSADIKSSNIKVILTDKASLLPENQELSYAFSTSNTEEPADWKTLNLTNSKDNTTSTGTISIKDLTGSYYLWIKEGLKDSYGNATKVYISKVFNFDNEDPECTLKLKDATADSVTVDATCNDLSGIKNYKYSYDDEDYVDNEDVSSKKINSFYLSKIKLKATDKAGNSSVTKFSDDDLTGAYETIKNALNDEYEKLNNDENNYKNEYLNKIYPIGSIYISQSSTDPSTIVGGTWERYGQGKTLIGVGNNGTTDYPNEGMTGGNESIALSTNNLPSHSHSFTPTGTVSSSFKGNSFSVSVGNHSHFTNSYRTSAEHSYGSALLPNGKPGGFSDRIIVSNGSMGSSSVGNHTLTYTASGTVSSSFKGQEGTSTSTGSGNSFNIMNPYVTVYMWKRTD